MLNVPNALTLLRILAVPLFLSALAEGQNTMALVVFIAAGVTDGIDGFIARMYDLRTELGAHLDPLADKMLVLSAFIALGLLDAIPLPLMIIVIMRDIVILGGFLLTAAIVGKSMEMDPSIAGKLTTFTQLLSITLVLVDRAALWRAPEMPLAALFVVTGLCCFWSGAGYVVRGIGFYNEHTSGDD